MKKLESRGVVIQNLKDAGCDQDIIEHYLLYFEGNQKEKQLALLEEHRKQLLNIVHKEERKIYCLDYLVYQINNIYKKEKGWTLCGKSEYWGYDDWFLQRMPYLSEYGTVFAGGVDKVGEIENHAALKKAYQMGIKA